jgi:hypothetical protein
LEVLWAPFAVEVHSLIEFSGIKIEQDNLSSAALLKSGWTFSFQEDYCLVWMDVQFSRGLRRFYFFG